MIRVLRLLIVTALISPTLFAADRSADEQKIWSLEHDYWHFVQANDLEHYRGLWHAQFLGWPYVSPEPVRKDHITDWMTDRTGRGESLKSYYLERLPIQLVDNVATTTYRIKMIWSDKRGVEQPATVRVIHTWLCSPSGAWQIVSGMSAPVDAEGH